MSGIVATFYLRFKILFDKLVGIPAEIAGK